jgi:hypothetical protein
MEGVPHKNALVLFFFLRTDHKFTCSGIYTFFSHKIEGLVVFSLFRAKMVLHSILARSARMVQSKTTEDQIKMFAQTTYSCRIQTTLIQTVFFYPTVITSEFRITSNCIGDRPPWIRKTPNHLAALGVFCQHIYTFSND